MLGLVVFVQAKGRRWNEELVRVGTREGQRGDVIGYQKAFCHTKLTVLALTITRPDPLEATFLRDGF